MAKYHLRKQDREITEKSVLLEILQAGKFATLAMCRENESYIVTMNYGYDSDKHALYFHTAPVGLKIDFIRANPHVCGTVIEDNGYVMGECEHRFRSVVFWGDMLIIDDLDEKKHGMNILLHQLEEQPESIKNRLLQKDSIYKKVTILRVDVYELGGKIGQ